MSPLSGNTGMNGSTQPTQWNDEGVLEAHGGPVDPSHSHYGNAGDTWPAAFGAGSQATQYGPVVNQGQRPAFNVPGAPMDHTPTTHQSPYPRGIIQPNLEEPGSYARAAWQLAKQQVQLHSPDLGGPRKNSGHAPGGQETPVDISVSRYDAPNANILSANVPGQLRGFGGASGGSGGSGWADTTQGYGKLNSTEEFTRGHSIRIVQHDRTGFDYTLQNGQHTAFSPKWPVQQADFNTDSEYGPVAGVATQGAQIPWEGHIGDPTAYQPPAEVTVNPAPSASPDVWSYGY